MTSVSTLGRSTPWKTGGSCHWLMIPTGISTRPARRTASSESNRRQSTKACSTSTEPLQPEHAIAFSHSASTYPRS